MAQQQRLKLTLRNAVADRTWTHQPVEFIADPDDHTALRAEIEKAARDLDSRTGDPWWADQYKGHIQGIDEAWRDFWVTGGER